MARCNSKSFVVNMKQMDKLKSDDLIAINVLDDLSSCAKIDTRNINTNNGNNLTNIENAFYNAANVPEDSFGCSKNKCFNSGTYQGNVKTAGEAVSFGDLSKTMDATLYAVGIVTAYVLVGAGEHKVKLHVANYTAKDWANYDEFETTVFADKAGFYPVAFDLTKLVKKEGTGWTVSQIGVKMRVMIDGTNLKQGDTVGVSSFAFYESIEDLEISKTILVSCVDTIGDTQSFDVVEAACSASGYDTKSGSMTFSLTANKMTENGRWLNPTLYKSDIEEFGVLNVVTRKVVAGTGELAGYGVIQVSDILEGDCGFFYIQTPGCANNSSELTRVSAPVPVLNPKTDADKFQVLTTDYKGAESLGLVLVGKDWVGQELNLIYRKKVTAEIYEVKNEFRDVHVNILAPFRRKDGVVEYHFYENAFLTTDANNISNSNDTAFELQFTVAADENGIRKKIVKPLDK